MLSVIIPLGPNDKDPTKILNELVLLPETSEIILAISHETVLACDIPKAVRIVESKSGRASQMNAAAMEAKGDFLWFLHADSRLGEGAIAKLVSKLSEKPLAFFYHDLEFLNDGPTLMKLNVMAVRFRSDILKIPFGDQGFCMSSKIFHDLGGYDETALYGEDHLLIWKARQCGIQVTRTGGTIFTSARKYEKGGWAKTTGLHVWLTIKQAAPEFFKLLKGKLQ